MAFAQALLRAFQLTTGIFTSLLRKAGMCMGDVARYYISAGTLGGPRRSAFLLRPDPDLP
jgi:hypothetical protein